MKKTEFWKIISLIIHKELEQKNDKKAVEPIVFYLSKQSESVIRRFQEYLSQTLYAIDGQKWLSEAGESSHSGDGFLYARCYVVAKGHDYYTNVLENPSAMPKSSDLWAESLLYVAGKAWAEVTGNDEASYDRKASVSYESFSNDAQW